MDDVLSQQYQTMNPFNSEDTTINVSVVQPLLKMPSQQVMPLVVADLESNSSSEQRIAKKKKKKKLVINQFELTEVKEEEALDLGA